MVSELVIVAFVVILGAYWFRYNCLAILKTRCSIEKAGQIAAANQLGFLELSEKLENADLDGVHEIFLRDYVVLTALLRYSSTLPTAGYAFDERLLMTDFRMLSGWYLLVRKIAGPLARRSLRERARILVNFANRMAERSATMSRI
jgi:hypothetical protein